MKKIIQKVKNRIDNNHEFFYILDLGRFSIKASLMELYKKTNSSLILDVVEASYPNLSILSEMNAEDLSQLTSAIKGLFLRLKKPNNKSKNKYLVIGLSSELVSGASCSNIYTREDPRSQIDTREVKNMVHNLMLRAYEDIRRKFTIESGYSETEVVLINTAIQKLQVDGQNTADPIGKTGKEIFVSLFNAYAPSFYKNAIEQVVKDLKFNSYNLVYTPYAIFSALKKIKKVNGDLQGLIIDVGGKTTRVILVKKGRIEEMRNFSFGGASFTRRIAHYLNLPESEAENIKLKYSNYNVSKNVRLFIDKLLQNDVLLFLNGLELILKDFSQASLLPGEIFLCGGGENVGVIDAIIKKRSWRKDLSFTTQPILRRLDVNDITGIKFAGDLSTNSHLVSIAALADYVVYTIATKQNILDKILYRTSNLVMS